MKIPFFTREGSPIRSRADENRRGEMAPGARTVAAILGMWLGSLTLGIAFWTSNAQPIDRRQMAEVLKALSELVDLETQDLQPQHQGPPAPRVPPLEDDQR